MPHAFEVEVRWQGGLLGSVEPSGVPRALSFSVPKEFGGPGGEWTPEHFFAASVGTCVMATFLSIAQASRLAITSYESQVSCSMEKVDGALRITGMTLKPRIVVPAEKDRERAERMLEKAEKMCPISNSVKPAITVAGTVEVGT